MVRTDAVIADEIKQTVSHLADLMNEARASDIVVNFSINETDVVRGKTTVKEFREIVVIQKIETL